MGNKKGFPIKWKFIILGFVVWNSLFAIDIISSLLDTERQGIHLGIGAFIAVIIAFITSLCLLIFPAFQNVVLKEGRVFNEIKRHVYPALLVTVIFIVIMSSHLFGNQKMIFCCTYVVPVKMKNPSEPIYSKGFYVGPLGLEH